MANVDSLRYFLPELFMIGLILAIFLIDLGLKKKKGPLGAIMVIGLLGTLYAVLKTPYTEGATLFLGIITLKNTENGSRSTAAEAKEPPSPSTCRWR